MDGMKMGTPWLDYPLSETYRAFECQFNETSLCDYESGYWRFWYEADHRYALPTVAFFLIAIAIFAIAHFAAQFAPESLTQTSVVRRSTALARFLSYRGFRIKTLNWNSASLGVLSLGTVGAIFFVCMTLAPKPYYWPNTAEIHFGNSPPIATRSGWLSLGCMPFVFATAGKSNLITAVTGVSHERLQVFHRWISYAFFITALMHTFPFIVYDIQSGTMESSWNGSLFYWTGVVALLAQAWLTFASMGPLRTLSYEWFKFSHFVAALVFMLFLFFHCDHTLSSWDYFIATGVLFSLSWLHRQVRIYFEHGIGHRATISLASNGFICVRVPTYASWTAGQHFFVRFLSLGLHAWSIHPFTACSLPTRVDECDTVHSELVFYIRAQGGFTARLARHAEEHPNGTMRVLLDGPCGGVDTRKTSSPQRQLIIAGGSGAGWILPMISTFLNRQPVERTHDSAKPERCEPPSAKVVLATRDLATRQWFEEAVQDLLELSGHEKLPETLHLQVHYTGCSSDETPPRLTREVFPTSHDPEKAPNAITTANITRPDSANDSDASSSSKPASVKHLDSRPDLPALIREESARCAPNAELGVFVCGPLSMQNDVSTAVAAEQIAVLKGSSSKEIYLHMEHFSWA